jgi:hypothetical protein
MTTEKVEVLAERLMAMSTADKLTLASMGLMDGRMDLEVVESIIHAALEDLQARRLLNIKRAPLAKGRP